MLTTKKAVSRLQEKGRYRKKGGANGILGMYPAGTGELGVIKSRDAFSDGREGDEHWYKHVEENTSGFSEAHRATSTAFEHAMYMRSISEWVVLMGFSPLVERALAPGPNVFEGLQIVQLDGQPNVMKAEMIVAMLSLMSVGDARAPKNLTLVRKIKEREAAAPNEPPAAKRAKESISSPSKAAKAVSQAKKPKVAKVAVTSAAESYPDDDVVATGRPRRKSAELAKERMGTMGNDDDDDDEWLDGSVGGGGGSIRMLGPAVDIGKTMAMRLATPPSKEASRFAKPRSAHRAQLELPTATASAGAATHVSRTDIMVVQATEVLDDDAEALVVTRTVSTKPMLGVYGAGAYKDECWSLQAYQKRVYAIRESYKVFLRGTGIENPGLDDRVCNLLSSIARLVGKQAVHVPDALIPKQVAALVQAADPKNRKLVLSAAMIAKGVCDTNRSKQESLLDHKDFRIELETRRG